MAASAASTSARGPGASAEKPATPNEAVMPAIGPEWKRWAGVVGGHLQLSITNAADVTQQGGDGADDGVAQRTVLTHGEEEYRQEHREIHWMRQARHPPAC